MPTKYCKAQCGLQDSLALFLSFYHSFIPQTFIEHLCVPGSVWGAGTQRTGVFVFRFAHGSHLHFPAMLRSPYASVLLDFTRCLHTCAQFLCTFFLFSNGERLSFFQTQVSSLPVESSTSLWRIIQPCIPWETNTLLEGYQVENLEEQRQGNSEGSK